MTGNTADIDGLIPNRACRNCSHIKAKCIPHNTSICQRCHRLGKQCTTAAPRKRQRARGPSLTPVSIQDRDSLAGTSGHSDLIRAIHQAVSTCDSNVNQPINTWVTDPTITSYTTRNAVNLFHISPEIGHNFVEQTHEALFDHFRVHMSKHFPFVAFRPEHSPAEVASEKPFLYTCCIMTANHRDPPMQTRIARDIIKYISERMLLAGEKNIDLLQGLSVLTAWYHVYTHIQPQLMNLLHLAKALLVDLGLNRPFDAGMYSLKIANDPSHDIHGNEMSSGAYSAEQRRICLAIYHTHTSFAYVFRRLDPAPWTEYLEECTKEFEANPEADSDVLMTATMRLDRIHEEYASDSKTRMGKTIPTVSYVKLFSRDLDSFRSSLPDVLKSNHAFLAHIHSIKISLLETTFMYTNGQILQKVEAMHLCLQTIYEFFREFNTQPDGDYSSLPFLTWARVAHALDVLARLSFARLDGWDLEYARNSPGFLSVVEDLIAAMKRLSEHEITHFPESKDARFKMFARRLEKFKQWYNKNLDAETQARSQYPANPTSESDTIADTSNTQTGFPEHSDFSWQDFMTLPNMNFDFEFLS